MHGFRGAFAVATRRILLLRVNVFDGTGAGELTDRMITIEDSTIAAIGPTRRRTASLRRPSRWGSMTSSTASSSIRNSTPGKSRTFARKMKGRRRCWRWHRTAAQLTQRETRYGEY
jgi:hypothetical protein